MADPKSPFLTPELHDYIVSHSAPLGTVQRELAEATRALGGISVMQIAPEQGAFLTLLARVIGARTALEIGTFTGYSALCIAEGLPDDGRLVCCDVSEEWTAIARSHWEKAGVADKIDLRLAPAIETLQALPTEPTFDLVFIDADKPSYPDYYEESLKRLRPDGVILVDNVLWMGSVVDAAQQDDNTRAIRRFNDQVAADERVDRVMLPIADGLTLIRPR